MLRNTTVPHARRLAVDLLGSGHDVRIPKHTVELEVRNMIRRLLAMVTLAALVVPGAAMAQDQEKYLELLRSDLRADKTAIVTTAMQLSDAEAEKFWPVYREYEKELASHNDKVVTLIKSYAAAYETMDDAKAKELANSWFKLQDERLNLRKSYYKKAEKAVSSTIAAQWLQVENQLGLLIDLQIASQMPLLEKGATPTTTER
jgi:hypothetical protein